MKIYMEDSSLSEEKPTWQRTQSARNLSKIHVRSSLRSSGRKKNFIRVSVEMFIKYKKNQKVQNGTKKRNILRFYKIEIDVVVVRVKSVRRRDSSL